MDIIKKRIDEQKETIDEKLFDFVFMPNYREAITYLAELASKEEWGDNNYILDNYIKQTFSKLASDYNEAADHKEQYILFDDEFNFFCFNTGLFSKFLEPIYFVSKRYNKANEEDKCFWYEVLFLTESDQQMINIFGTNVSLPDRAFFFDDPAELVYDYRKKINVNTRHILEDEKNISRLPEDVRVANPTKQAEQLKAAISTAIKECQSNYKIAVPQFYNGKVQLLMPLAVGVAKDGEKNLALVISKKDGQYRGRTCLKTSWAYMNARLLVRPESTWLKPSKVKEIEED